MRIATIFFFLLATAADARAQNLDAALSRVPNDENCQVALSLAERGLLEKMPSSLSLAEADKKLLTEHRLVGIWYDEEKTCEVFDLMELKDSDDLRSPHEILEEDVLEPMKRDGHITDYEVAGNGVFFRIFYCELCL